LYSDEINNIFIETFSESIRLEIATDCDTDESENETNTQDDTVCQQIRQSRLSDLPISLF